MEDSIEARGEAQQIFKVLSKDDQDKMPFEGIEIAKTLARIPFFKRFFDTNSEHFINLCISQTVAEHPPGTQLYSSQQSPNPRFLYVLLEGSVTLTAKDGSSRSLGILRVFGQLQIVFLLAERQEQAICETDCKLMCIQETALLRIFSGRQRLDKCLRFLNANPYFEVLTSVQKMQLALGMNKCSFEPGQVLKLEERGLEHVMFFIYGKAEVVVKLSPKGQDYVIDQLDEMSSFGEYECVQGVATSVGVRGARSGGYYLLSWAEMKAEGHRVVGLLEEKACPYPSIEQLLFLQNVKVTLRRQEKRVLKQFY